MSDTSSESPSVQFANELIGIANSALEQGGGVDDISAGMRHAAANFSAFACVHMAHSGQTEEGPSPEKMPEHMIEEFARMLAYYLDIHTPQPQPEDPAGGLKDLIEQVKNES